MYNSPTRKRNVYEDQQMDQYLTPEQNKQGSKMTRKVCENEQYPATTEKQFSEQSNTPSYYSPQPNRELYQDRFIPCRTSNIARSLFGLMTQQQESGGGGSSSKKGNPFLFSPPCTNPHSQTTDQSTNPHQAGDEENLEKQKNYSNLLQKQLLFGEGSSAKKSLFDINDENYGSIEDEAQQTQQHFNLLKYKTPAQEKLADQPPISLFGIQPQIHQNPEKRLIQKQPVKVLDAPGLIDDFYVDTLDWSTHSQNIAICLGDSVYLWDPQTGEARNLTAQHQTPFARHTSLKFRPHTTHLAVSNSEGKTTLYDTETSQIVHQFMGNREDRRIGTMSFNTHGLLATGGKDGYTYLWDLRQQNSISQLRSHRQEVCGLSWSPNDNCLASGGNDNLVMVYNLTASKFQNKLSQHKAAIRALDWSPHQSGVLITGGGTKDQTICVWNTLFDTLLRQIQVDSQVCKLMYSKNSQQFVSTHGFEKNEIVIWNSRDYTRQQTLHGHDRRVLYLSLSPDSQTIVTGSKDETLKFWKVFPPKKNDHPISQLQFSISDLR